MTTVLLALGLLVLWLLTVPLWTLVFYWALMHVDKGEHEGWADPDTVRMARRWLLPLGAINNLACAWTWAAWHYKASPIRLRRVEFALRGRPLALTLPLPYPGVTKFTNAMIERGGWRGARAFLIRARYLNFYDRRGIHT